MNIKIIINKLYNQSWKICLYSLWTIMLLILVTDWIFFYIISDLYINNIEIYNLTKYFFNILYLTNITIILLWLTTFLFKKMKEKFKV